METPYLEFLYPMLEFQRGCSNVPTVWLLVHGKFTVEPGRTQPLETLSLHLQRKPCPQYSFLITYYLLLLLLYVCKYHYSTNG